MVYTTCGKWEGSVHEVNSKPGCMCLDRDSMLKLISLNEKHAQPTTMFNMDKKATSQCLDTK